MRHILEQQISGKSSALIAIDSSERSMVETRLKELPEEVLGSDSL